MHIHISHLPNDPWVYLFKDAKGNILYIGKAKNLQKRVTQYFSPGSLRKQEMLAKASFVDFLVVKNEGEALYLESNLIKKHKPFYNTMLKGGNGYTYIKLTKHEFPQILLTRIKKNDKATYIWPKHNTQELRKLLQYLRYILQYRTCGNVQFKKKVLCSDYYLKLCNGWCAGCPIFSWGGKKSAPNELQEEYEGIMKQVISFFKGDTQGIAQEIIHQIEMAITRQHFERAAHLRDIYYHIEQFVEKQHVELPKNLTGYVLEIRQIWTRNVFVLLNFYEGRLIDVVRDKIAGEEGDFSHMLAGFEMELGEFQKSEDYSRWTKWVQQMSKKRLLVMSKGMKFLKSEQQALEQMMDNFFESYLIVNSFEGDTIYNDLLITLQKTYQLKHFPYRMECVDISHLSGSWMSGGLSCMIGGLLEKKQYRKYNIRSTQGQSDDYTSLKEVLTRRFCKNDSLNRSNSDNGLPRPNDEIILPEVMILDGGKGQLGVVKTLYDENEIFRQLFTTVDFIALGKGEARKKSAIGARSVRSSGTIVGERVYRFDKNRNIIEIPLTYDQADRLLLKLRDEAHRFSNVYRKQQMKKELS